MIETVYDKVNDYGSVGIRLEAVAVLLAGEAELFLAEELLLL